MMQFLTNLMRAIARVFAPAAPTIAKVGFQPVTDDICHNADGSTCRASDLKL